MSNKVRIALFEPRIPQNTGNIARTTAAYDFTLDLIKPLGFSIEDKYLRRAGLDYWKYVDINVHENYKAFLDSTKDSRLIAFSKFGSKQLYNIQLKVNDVLLFGREDHGLPESIKNTCSEVIKIPMSRSADRFNKNGVRSLNLSVSCGIVSYKAYVDIKQSND
tara:strand:- start:71 stop:559 length:489 start_codon:yes stop_codon:yes gene_type:complete